MDDTFVALEAGAIPLPPLFPTIIGEGEGVNMWTCAAFDPGGTTGWALIQVHPFAMEYEDYRILDNIQNWSCGQINGSLLHQADKMIELVDAWPEAHVVCEDFILRSSVMSRDLLDPVRLGFNLQWWLERGGQRAWDAEEDGPDAWKARPLYFQQPSLAMGSITDERLKLFGAYHFTAGKPHARDALRHALTFARRWKARQVGAPVPIIPQQATPQEVLA